jgi:trimeric autotransporter adhesin
MSRSGPGRRHWRRAVLTITGAWLMAAIIASTAAAATTSVAQISTFAGSSQPGPVPATSVGIGATGVATSGGNLFIADVNGEVVREVTSKGVQTVTAGDGSYHVATSDGRLATTTGLSNPTGVAVDSRGDQLIADEANERVRLVAASACSSACPFGLPSMTARDIYTVAGTGVPGYSGDGGPGTAANLYGPTGVATDARGDLLIGDGVNNRVRIVAASACTSSCPFALSSMTAGDIYTIAGNGNAGYTGDGGPATAAAVHYPVGVATDLRGDVLITENIENRVRIVAASSCSSACPLGLASMTAGHIYLVAGNGTAGFSGDGGPGTAAELSDPYGVGADAKGDLLIADSNNARVRMVATSACSSACPFGLASTVAGDIYTIAHTAAGYPAFPTGVTADSKGNLLIADGYANVRMVAGASCSSACPFGLSSTTAGQMYVVAGNGSWGYSGDSGAATAAGVSVPRGVATDSKNDVLIADTTDNRVRMVAGASCSSACPFGLASTVMGRIYTVAGNGNIGYSGDGGPATSAVIWNPDGVAVDAKGNLFITDTFNSRVRMVAAASCSSACPLGLHSTVRGDIYTVAGDATPGYSGDGGPATSAEFNSPESVTVDSKGDLIISDTGNARVRLVAAASCSSACPLGLAATTTGDVYTVAGGGSGGLGDGGPARSGQLSNPAGVALDSKGNLLIADVNDGRVRLVAGAACSSSCPLGLTSTTRGDIYTVAGGGTSSGDGGPATSAALGLSAQFTSGVALDARGDLLIGDGGTNRVRLVANASCTTACPLGLSATTRGDIYTVAGGGTAGLGDRGLSTAAQLSSPSGLAVNARGDLFIADAQDNRVRFVTVPPRNTVRPVISGTPKSGQTLTTTTGTWVSPSDVTYGYRWLRCTSTGTTCVIITGATASSYTPASADVGHELTVSVTATDVEGQAGSASATAVGPVTS